MQAIILAAGNGIRFEPLSVTKPKPVFTVLGKSILEHNLNQLSGLVDEAIIVTSYKKEMIKEKIGDVYGKIKITYIDQEEISGTGAAAKSALSLIKDKFVLLNGDDFYSKEDIKKAIDLYPSILVHEHENPSSFGVIVGKDNVENIVEKPTNPVSNLVNTGLYCLPKSIFEYKIEKSPRGEYEFTDYIKNFIKDNSLHICISKFWFPASYPWDLLNAIPSLIAREKKINKGNIEKGAVIKGEVIIGMGTVVKSGSYIEGPVYIGENCIIGPNCFIRENSVIEDNCRIGQAVEIKDSIISKGTNVAHLSYVGDSVIGENCNLAAGTVITNLRHDKNTIKTLIKGELLDTKRIKLGAIIGDDVKTGAGTIIYPGRKIWPEKVTMPGEKVDKDIK